MDLEDLFGSFYRRLARLLYRVTGDMAQAEAVASEAFWRLHAKPPSAETNLEGWLYRTGLRIALDQLKQERRRTRYEALAAVPVTAGPPALLEQGEERERVRLVLAALKPEYAAFILLRADGLGYTEIAAVLKLKPSSIGTMLGRAEDAFRKEYVTRYGKPRIS